MMHVPKPKLRTYVSGYIMSLILTLAAYLLVTHPGYSTAVIVALMPRAASQPATRLCRV